MPRTNIDPARRALWASLRLPVVAAPMFLVSGPELVVAACKAGIVGSFPNTNARTIEEYEDCMRRVTDALAQARAADPSARVAPWAANLITHSSNVRLQQDLALIARYRPPLVITALGSPEPALDVVHAYGGLVIADVINLKYARKAAATGCDGLACIAVGAGGHTGHLSPFAFISAVREHFDGLVIVGGGISDGWGVAGAVAAGADLVYMGTRFIPTPESLAPAGHKQMIVEHTAEDLLVSAGITGAAASWLTPSLRAAGLDPQKMPERPDVDVKRANEPRRWRDIWSAGQGITTIHAVEPVAEVVLRLEQEYRAARARFAAIETAA